MKAIDVLKYLLAKAESEVPEGHRIVEVNVPVDIVREIIDAQPEPAIPISWIKQEIERLESRKNSFAVMDAVQKGVNNE